jgi:GNAT superfamily N-acetyltransferase
LRAVSTLVPMVEMNMSEIRITTATEADVPVILEMIRGLADYEKLSHVVRATEQQLRHTLFGERPAAEVLLAHLNAEPVGFALFFPNYSTFLAQPGIYLEDLFVKPHARGKGAGLALFMELARIAVARGCGRVEWAVLDWNKPSIGFYKKLGAVPMDEWTTFRLTSEPLARLAAMRADTGGS